MNDRMVAMGETAGRRKANSDFICCNCILLPMHVCLHVRHPAGGDALEIPR